MTSATASNGALALVAPFALVLGSCAMPQTPSAEPPLTGTEWSLVEFESSDDAIGVIRPRADEVYTLQLDPDGTAAIGLYCNRGTGRWSSPDADANIGSLLIEPLAITRAACPPSPLARIGNDLARVRTFVITGGRLHLNLMTDSGNYVWTPLR